MAKLDQKHGTSWLSLVAETAGVCGATIARIEVQAYLEKRRPVRAVVQIHDSRGIVVGATYWEGDSWDLAHGVKLDLGCDLETSLGSRLVGWIDDKVGETKARLAQAPIDASAHYFDPTRAMKLMLRAPTAPGVAAQAAA